MPSFIAEHILNLLVYGSVSCVLITFILCAYTAHAMRSTRTAIGTIMTDINDLSTAVDDLITTQATVLGEIQAAMNAEVAKVRDAGLPADKLQSLVDKLHATKETMVAAGQAIVAATADAPTPAAGA